MKGAPMTYRVATSQSDDDMPIEELDLSVRAYNCLKRSGIRSVAQIFALSRQELLAIRNMGSPGRHNLYICLVERGLMDRYHPRAPFTIDDGTLE